MYEYLGNILEIANVFISLFVLIYAWSFLRQTADVRDRRPWVYLFFAAIVFFFFEVFGVLNIFNVSKVPGLEGFLESAFIALILFVFIFQYDLILKSDLILITRKIAREEADDERDKLIADRLKQPISLDAQKSGVSRPGKKGAPAKRPVKKASKKRAARKKR